jgi:hypothetical protein
MTERDTANYIADMVLELRNLAKGSNMTTLQGLLEISYYEAYNIGHPTVVSDEELKHIEDLGADARRAKIAA